MRRRSPWTMPACTALACLIWALAVVLVPRDWIFLLPDPRQERHQAPADPVRRWLDILPPPEVEVTPEVDPPRKRPEVRRPPPPPAEDPRWWTEAWRIRIEADFAPPPPGPAAADSVAVLLRMLGAPADLLARVDADSTLARILALTRLSDAYLYEELKPYLAAAGRAEDYRDLMSRAADMYDDFLSQEIITPD